eukprot:4113401-Prymnesium_polylepis.1
MAVSLEELRAQLALLHGRLSEQEHALAQSARDIEHTNAKQRRAQRQAEDSNARAELAEKQLEAIRRELSRSKDRVERLELAAVATAGARSRSKSTRTARARARTTQTLVVSRFRRIPSCARAAGLLLQTRTTPSAERPRSS